MLSRERGQMAVELCVVMPVILMVLVVVVDGLLYVSECARFDHLAAQAVLSIAASPSGSEFDQTAGGKEIEERLGEEFVNSNELVSVSSGVGTSSAVAVYTCKLEVTPWPLGSAGMHFFTMTIPTLLTHEYSFAVRPYVIGEI